MDRFPFDDEYVRRLRLRDRETTEHFTRYMRGVMMPKFHRKLRSVADIEDLLQETLLRVFQKLDAVKDGHAFGAFASRTADHVYQEKVREDLRAKRPDAILPRQQQTSALDDLITEEARQRTRRTVESLDVRDREILRALFLDEEDKDVICARYGVTRDYLRVLKHRALENFRGEFL